MTHPFCRAAFALALAAGATSMLAEGSAAQSLKKMLRCRLRLSGMAVHSYEQNVVNLPGWLFSSAIFTFSFQMLPATSGS